MTGDGGICKFKHCFLIYFPKYMDDLYSCFVFILELTCLDSAFLDSAGSSVQQAASSSSVEVVSFLLLRKYHIIQIVLPIFKI